MIKHYTIPFFIPHIGCPNQCVFCNQNNITHQEVIEPCDVSKKIDEYLETMPTRRAVIEVGFFGGTFTGLSLDKQKEYLEQAVPYVENGSINGIRLSTRPDYISNDILKILKKYHVKCIELGVQSMSDTVLKAAKRGHT